MGLQRAGRGVMLAAAAAMKVLLLLLALAPALPRAHLLEDLPLPSTGANWCASFNEGRLES